MKWFVFHTNPRNEKKVSERLMTKGYEVFLPVQKTLRQWSDRKKKVEEPLYKSYVFFHGTESDRLEAMQTQGIVRCLFHNGKPASVREKEIEAIKQFLGLLEEYPEVELVHFNIGDKVEIKSGALKGLNGEYISRHGDVLFLRVETMGRIIQAKMPVRYILS